MPASNPKRSGPRRDERSGDRSRERPSALPAPTGRFQDPHAAREAERYADPIPSREAILQMLASAEGPMSVETLASHLHLETFERRDALGKRLAAMLRDGQLLQNRRGGYLPAARMDLIAGTVIANRDGFGFLRPDAVPGQSAGDDLFLPPLQMRKVLHGDRALASVTGLTNAATTRA